LQVRRSLHEPDDEPDQGRHDLPPSRLLQDYPAHAPARSRPWLRGEAVLDGRKVRRATLLASSPFASSVDPPMCQGSLAERVAGVGGVRQLAAAALHPRPPAFFFPYTRAFRLASLATARRGLGGLALYRDSMGLSRLAEMSSERLASVREPGGNRRRRVPAGRKRPRAHPPLRASRLDLDDLRLLLARRPGRARRGDAAV
jgi:hypothetical protein